MDHRGGTVCDIATGEHARTRRHPVGNLAGHHITFLVDLYAGGCGDYARRRGGPDSENKPVERQLTLLAVHIKVHMVETITFATGREPTVIGKPRPQMALLAMERTGFSPEQTVLLGDRLYTDVACGVNAGIDTVFVLSGEGTMADIDTYQIHPTWVYPDIGTLYRKLEETV